MQSLLGVDLFGTHGDDMKQISDRKEHQTQNRIRGEYENREGPWRGDPGPRVHDSTHFFSTKTSPRHDGSSIADYFVDKPEHAIEQTTPRCASDRRPAPRVSGSTSRGGVLLY